MSTQQMSGATQAMTARSVADAVDPLRQNPIRAAVARARGLNDDLTARQREVRDLGRARVDALVASGCYSLAPRR